MFIDRNKLAPPIASGNVILENMRDVSKFNQEELFRPRGFHIDRGKLYSYLRGRAVLISACLSVCSLSN